MGEALYVFGGVMAGVGVAVLMVRFQRRKLMGLASEALAAVHECNTVGDSLVALAAMLFSKLGTVPPEVQAAIDSIIAETNGQKQKYADAVVANTPVAPATPA